MKVIQVTYTTQLSYAAQNQENIRAVMKSLQELNNKHIFYHVCTGADGKTFIHTAFFKTEEDNQVLLSLPSFQYFQEQLKASIPEIAPQQQRLDLVGASQPIFE